jgi:hypothetical protein
METDFISGYSPIIISGKWPPLIIVNASSNILIFMRISLFELSDE